MKVARLEPAIPTLMYFYDASKHESWPCLFYGGYKTKLRKKLNKGNFDCIYFMVYIILIDVYVLGFVQFMIECAFLINYAWSINI